MPDDIIEDITDHSSDSTVAVAPQPGESSIPLSPGASSEDETILNVGKPPPGHRIRVDPDDLTQGKNESGKSFKESDDDFRKRRHDYRTAPDQYSPTGRKKGKIYLYDWEVKCVGSKGNVPQWARINSVPSEPDAIREFLLLRGIKHAAGYRFRAFLIPGTKKDAGDEGYSAAHLPMELRQHRANAGG